MKIRNLFLNRLKRKLIWTFRIDRLKYIEDYNILDTAEVIKLSQEEIKELNKINIAIIKDTDDTPYYTKFERILKNNNIEYSYFNIHKSNWLDEAKKYDIILWRPLSLPWELDEAREKIYILENYMKKLVYPSYSEICFYENKAYQYDLLKLKELPVIDTFISYDYDEITEYVKQEKNFPFVSKIKVGSGSQGVELIKKVNLAKKKCRQVFTKGAKTYWPFLRQKNYVYFQKFIKNYNFDLRIVVVDEENIFGYYRETTKNDFRASGYGNVVKKELPKEAVKIAIELKNKLNLNSIAVDFLKAVSDEKYYIIECSNYIKIDTDKQLELNGVAGKYEYDKENEKLIFNEGRYWIQELIIRNILRKYLRENKEK